MRPFNDVLYVMHSHTLRWCFGNQVDFYMMDQLYNHLQNKSTLVWRVGVLNYGIKKLPDEKRLDKVWSKLNEAI